MSKGEGSPSSLSRRILTILSLFGLEALICVGQEAFFRRQICYVSSVLFRPPSPVSLSNPQSSLMQALPASIKQQSLIPLRFIFFIFIVGRNKQMKQLWLETMGRTVLSSFSFVYKALIGRNKYVQLQSRISLSLSLIHAHTCRLVWILLGFFLLWLFCESRHILLVIFRYVPDRQYYSTMNAIRTIRYPNRWFIRHMCVSLVLFYLNII